jgi:hypothetical protein
MPPHGLTDGAGIGYKAWAQSRQREEVAMASEYVVGMHLDDRRGSVTVQAEDALIAALKVKQQNPAASITYVRKQNKRGDIRHAHDTHLTDTKTRKGK